MQYFSALAIVRFQGISSTFDELSEDKDISPEFLA